MRPALFARKRRLIGLVEMSFSASSLKSPGRQSAKEAEGNPEDSGRSRNADSPRDRFVRRHSNLAGHLITIRKASVGQNTLAKLGHKVGRRIGGGISSSMRCATSRNNGISGDGVHYRMIAL